MDVKRRRRRTHCARQVRKMGPAENDIISTERGNQSAVSNQGHPKIARRQSGVKTARKGKRNAKAMRTKLTLNILTLASHLISFPYDSRGSSKCVPPFLPRGNSRHLLRRFPTRISIDLPNLAFANVPPCPQPIRASTPLIASLHATVPAAAQIPGVRWRECRR